MTLQSGQQVRIKVSGLTGSVIKKRPGDEDIYLIQIENKYFKSSELEPIEETVDKYSPETDQEWANIAKIFSDHPNGLGMSNQTIAELIASLEKVGAIVNK